MKESNSPTWQIDLQCPQCGAPLVIEETDRMLACSFCRVRLYLAVEAPFRYYLPPPKQGFEDVLYAPYWRFKGMVFTLERAGISERLADTSLLALRSSAFPSSLGVRPQVLHLRHLTPDMEVPLLRPEYALQGYPVSARPQSEAHRRTSTGSGASLKAFIGDVISLIYAPFRIRDGKLFDAILERPVAPCPADLLETAPRDRGPKAGIRFVPVLCPHCGWDLEGEKNALVLLCRNCNSAWQASSQENFERVPFSFAFPAESQENWHYLPFWRIRGEVSDFNLRSYADLVRFANLPRAVQKQWEEQPLAFWIPAFKIQPQLFMRLSRNFTSTQPPAKALQDLPRVPLHPVTLPLSEAIESIRVLLVGLAVRRELFLARLPQMLIETQDPSLVYVPFELKGSELIQPDLQLSVNANAVHWGQLL